ncbi:MAG: DUF5681 domain-containing protein, partial [Actinomycetota bacterium]|nr:DUF5681 domain-containing protein [Actinomycetota bacterium]
GSVGRGRPPVHSQFKPGQSGNPPGRPKGSKNFITLLYQEAAEQVTIPDRGRSRKLRVCQLSTARSERRSLGLMV